MDNREIAHVLRETAQLLEIDGAIIGRYRTYEKAAELIETMTESVAAIADGKLTELPGIGDSIAEHIPGNPQDRRLHPPQETPQRNIPPRFSNSSASSRSAPRKSPCSGTISRPARGRHRKTRPRRQTARSARLRRKNRAEHSRRRRSHNAHRPFPDQTRRHGRRKLREYILRLGEAVAPVTPAGSLRRGKETIGDLDLLVTLRPGPRQAQENRSH